jgi:hypothetical protein
LDDGQGQTAESWREGAASFYKWMMRLFSVSRAVLVLALGLGGPTGCVVWKDDYDVMAAKYRNEAAAHELAKADLAKRGEEIMKLQSQVASLEASLTASNKRLDQNAESMAEAEHQYSILEQERTDAADLVNQLRSEQERLASHLQAYANDRAELNAERERLTQELQDAELRVNALTFAQKRAQARLALVRDLSLKLQPEIDKKQAELLFDGDVVVLRLEATKMFAAKSVSKDGKRLLAAAGNALRDGSAKPSDKAAGTKPTPSKSGGAATTPIAPAAPAKPAEPPTRLVLSQWEKGQKLKDSAERLKLAAYELALAGVEPTRFAHEKVLLTYQENVRTALTKPAPVDGSAETAPPPPAPTSTFAVSGSSLVIHLVPQ